MPERNDRTPDEIRREQEKRPESKETAEAPESASPELRERAAVDREIADTEESAAETTAAIDSARQEFADDPEAQAELDALMGTSEKARERMAQIEGEIAREDLLEGVNEGIQTAIELVRARFEDTDSEKDKLPFHQGNHTSDVATRTRKILEAIQRGAPDKVDDRTVQIGQLVGAFHDTVQRWVPNEVKGPEGDVRIMRKRLQTPANPEKNDNPVDEATGKPYAGNETASAAEAVAFIDGFNAKRREDGLPEVFTEEDKRVAERAIDHTVPLFVFEKGTVVQPRLKEESDIISRAVALADLGEAGMNPEGFESAGDLLFREENLDILDASKDPKALSDAQKEFYRKRMLGWSKFQPKFAAGRKAELEKELAGLPEAAAAEVRKLFTRFDESIAAVNAVAARRETMTFEELLKDMGYGSDGPEAAEKAA
ncbi:MAG TPA: hypothetical protein VLC10_05440 [Patescibacteria group bacterium]|nr:hypothetical protein [Patescibacteria group bacterium]